MHESILPYISLYIHIPFRSLSTIRRYTIHSSSEDQGVQLVPGWRWWCSSWWLWCGLRKILFLIYFLCLLSISEICPYSCARSNQGSLVTRTQTGSRNNRVWQRSEQFQTSKIWMVEYLHPRRRGHMGRRGRGKNHKARQERGLEE